MPITDLDGIKLVAHNGMEIKPKWYDLPRRLGLRPLKREAIIEPGQALFDKSNGIAYVRTDDYDFMRRTFNRPDDSQYFTRWR